MRQGCEARRCGGGRGGAVETSLPLSGFWISSRKGQWDVRYNLRMTKQPLKNICVYCGSSDDVDARYYAAARRLGAALAARGYTLVYGGGSTGLMGAVADAALEAGGEAIGVIPEVFYTPQLAHTALTRLEIVPDMHARKARMIALADAFIAMPGGYGTWEEVFEALTWAQIGLHTKPIGFYNVHGYYTPLLQFIRHAREEGFLFAEHEALFVHADDPVTLLTALAAYRHPGGVARWMREDT